MVDDERVRVGIGVVVERDGQVLLMRRRGAHGAGSWSTPGGHLDPGERFDGCALRELEEETGLVGASASFLALTNDVMLDEGRHYVTIWMRVHGAVGSPRIAAAREMSELAWFAWDALPEPLFTSFGNLVAGRTCGQLEPVRMQHDDGAR